MASRHASFGEGGYSAAVMSPFKFALAFSIFFLTVLITAWIAQYVSVFFIWDRSTQPLIELLQADAMSARQGFGFRWFTERAADWAQAVHSFMFVRSSIEPVLSADPATLSHIDRAIQRMLLETQPAFETIMLGTKLIVVRFTLLMSAAPAIAMGYGLGYLDGMVERYVRRACGGRESGGLYHRAKYGIAGSIGIATIAYLCLPLSISMDWAAPCLAVLVALLARLQWKYYKKYA